MKSEARSIFLESRTTVQMIVNQQGLLQAQREVVCGAGVSDNISGYSTYQWYPLATGITMSTPAQLPIELHTIARELHEPRMEERFDRDEVAGHLLLLLEKTREADRRVELSLHAYDQQIAVNDTTAWKRDQRRYATLNVRVFVRSEGREKSISRSYAYPSLADLRAALPNIVALINSQATLADTTRHVVRCPEGDMPVVLGPGHAGVFFHEVCGHPLEGDIVISDTSYLAPWIGQRAAEEWVTLVDDPTAGTAKMSHTIDDEGTPSRPAYLIEHGIIREPLLDRRSASILDLEPNGHGRRLDFRHYAVPRMIHTQVVPHSSSSADACEGIQRGLLIDSLKLRHMNIASGDFSFTITEARLIEHGKPGPYVGPGLLYGNGLRCLREIDFIGNDDVHFLNGGAGCGKLDQWPLVVSFGQPAVRFRSLRVQPW